MLPETGSHTHRIRRPCRSCEEHSADNRNIAQAGFSADVNNMIRRLKLILPVLRLKFAPAECRTAVPAAHINLSAACIKIRLVLLNGVRTAFRSCESADAKVNRQFSALYKSLSDSCNTDEIRHSAAASAKSPDRIEFRQGKLCYNTGSSRFQFNFKRLGSLRFARNAVFRRKRELDAPLLRSMVDKLHAHRNRCARFIRHVKRFVQHRERGGHGLTFRRISSLYKRKARKINLQIFFLCNIFFRQPETERQSLPDRLFCRGAETVRDFGPFVRNRIVPALPPVRVPVEEFTIQPQHTDLVIRSVCLYHKAQFIFRSRLHEQFRKRNIDRRCWRNREFQNPAFSCFRRKKHRRCLMVVLVNADSVSG